MLLELAEIFINNLVPLFIISGVGFAIRRTFKTDPVPISTLIFYVFSPCLVFVLLLESDIGGDEFARLFFATVVLHLTMAAIAYGISHLLHANAIERANMILGSFCLNAGNYGLVLIAFAFDETILSRAAVVFIANVTLNFSFGVFVASNGRSSILGSLRNVLMTPTVYSVTAAFIIKGLQITLPPVIERPITTLSEASLPLMLVLLGLQLGQFGRFDRLHLVGSGVVLRLLAGPAIGLLLASLFHMPDAARTAFIMQASMPTAVVTIILTTQFELDRDLALNQIMLSTLISPITLSFLIFLLQ